MAALGLLFAGLKTRIAGSALMSTLLSPPVLIVAAIAIAYAVGWSTGGAKVEARDNEWQARTSEANRESDRGRALMHKSGDDAAAKERERVLREVLDAETERAAELEKAIAKLQRERRDAGAVASAVDPVAVPRALSQELRR